MSRNVRFSCFTAGAKITRKIPMCYEGILGDMSKSPSFKYKPL